MARDERVDPDAAKKFTVTELGPPDDGKTVRRFEVSLAGDKKTIEVTNRALASCPYFQRDLEKTLVRIARIQIGAETLSINMSNRDSILSHAGLDVGPGLSSFT